MMGIKDSTGGRFKSKKMLKELCATGEGLVIFEETSIFGAEFKGAGTYVVVGPTPHDCKWFASVTVDDARNLVKVT